MSESTEKYTCLKSIYHVFFQDPIHIFITGMENQFETPCP